MNIRVSTLVMLVLHLSKPLLAQPVPFEVCTESTTWVRPSPEVQAKVWNDPRYKGFSHELYPWNHNFLVIDDPLSATVTDFVSNMSGLWTAKEEWLKKCYLGQRRNGYEWIEVWSLLHRVTAITRSANTYTVTVQPVTKGFQWIYIRRMNPSVVLRFVTADGKEVERWDESSPPR
jgi:hypothetical protein